MRAHEIIGILVIPGRTEAEKSGILCGYFHV